jgi:TolB-like protein/Tfp pilus assembly protein PilF/tRNA A-37 threonylcarbamoyl transferase component Bud32
MKAATRICDNCADEIFDDAPKGLCPACLIDTAIDLLRSEDGEEVDSSHLSKRNGAENLRELGDYELLQEIGRGAQGVVYRARQKSLNRIVALKIIGLGHWATKVHVKRFRLEAEAAARLDHPFIVPIHEIGQSNGSCYFSMQLVEGGQLDQVVKREPMASRTAAKLIAKLARTVHHAHQRGILHRDIKPGNILLDAKGDPHLTDFGLARLLELESSVTRTTEAIGTPSYMAPEQARGDNAKLSSATDVYGLGAVLYQLLTGHPPFLAETTYETIRLVLETEPRQPRLLNPKVDRDLSTICLKCLEKDPKQRYASALALAEDLEHWLRDEPTQARRAGILIRANKWVRRKPLAAALVVSLVALGGVIGWNIWKSQVANTPAITGIAVLPFENLSDDDKNASLADGVQDDILTKLAKIADLKVISRTSVMQFRGKHNVRDIGEALRISHVLEGSVRKVGNRLHLNAQLIDARTDTHLWAEQYDRDLSDMFAVQTEIAQKIAEKLHAKMSADERIDIHRAPTSDLTAFDLYIRAKNLVLTTSAHVSGRDNLLEATNLLDEAVNRDPSFFEAYCQLAHTHDRLYHLGYDHSSARLARAEAALQQAIRLRPETGEAHLARAEHLYRGYIDYNGALAELEAASRIIPNNSQVFELKGYILRRQGRPQEALQNLERAADLDPRNVLLLQQIALSYDHLRRYSEEKAAWQRALIIARDDVHTLLPLANVELQWKGDIQPLRRLVDSIRSTNPAQIPQIADAWFVCALIDRNASAAKDALIALGDAPLSYEAVELNHLVLQGIIARMSNDDAQASASFTAARAEQEKIVHGQPNYAPALCVLGLIDAALGRKEEALSEGRRAVQLLPVEKDAVNGPVMIEYLAMIAAWVGDRELACEQLAISANLQGGVNYGYLKLLPYWDPLRGDPRFEKVVASLAPR